MNVFHRDFRLNGGSLKSTQFMIDVFTQTTGGRPSAIACHDSPASFDPNSFPLRVPK
jgi:hypothetical protein